MPQTSIQELLAEMEATVAEWRELLAQHLDFAGLEQAITARMNELGAELVKQVVEPLLVDADYVERLKRLGGQRGLKFKEYRTVRVRLSTGQWIEVKTAYFVKAQPKSRKRPIRRRSRSMAPRRRAKTSGQDWASSRITRAFPATRPSHSRSRRRRSGSCSRSK